jgi:hypothetical protein
MVDLVSFAALFVRGTDSLATGLTPAMGAR